MDPLEIAVGESDDTLIESIPLRVRRETESTWLVSRKKRGRFRAVARIQQLPDGWLADPFYGDIHTDVLDTWQEAIQSSTGFRLDAPPSRTASFALLGSSAVILIVAMVYPVVTGGRVFDFEWALLTVAFGLICVGLVIQIVERNAQRRRRRRASVNRLTES